MSKLNSLVEKYPVVYNREGKHTTFAIWGFECGEGWYNLLDVLGSIIITELSDNRDLDFKLNQVKEKFGSLRFYYEGGNDTIWGAVSFAEQMSNRTCERCGDVGNIRNDGWVVTLCDKHQKEWEDKNGRSVRRSPEGETKALKKKTQKRGAKVKHQEKNKANVSKSAA